MARGLTISQTVPFTKASSKMGNDMAGEQIHGQMEVNMMENGWVVKGMVMEFSAGLMVKAIWVNGKMVSIMARELTL
jgi:hypothetical protein